MPLAGLVLTDDEAFADGVVTGALMPVAGQTLVEYQVRIVRACGAAHIVVLVDRIPAPLVAAFDRLRAEGIDIDIARTAREAADRIHPEEQLLVMAAGAVASREIVARLVERAAPTLLTIRDREGVGHYERIDGFDRWAGLALLNGQQLRDTAAILGDWTLGPTLLRTALQAGAGRMNCDGGSMSLVRNDADAKDFAQALAKGNAAGGAGFWQSQCVDPVVRWLLPRLLGPQVSLGLVSALAPGMMVAAMLAGVFGWLSASFGLFLLSGFPLAAARAMADIAARPDRALRWTADAKLPLLLALLGFAGWALNLPGQGWGPMVLALWAGLALMLQPRSSARAAWLADADLIALELFMSSLIGQPVLGLMIAVAHAVTSQFWLVRHPG